MELKGCSPFCVSALELCTLLYSGRGPFTVWWLQFTLPVGEEGGWKLFIVSVRTIQLENWSFIGGELGVVAGVAPLRVDGGLSRWWYGPVRWGQ